MVIIFFIVFIIKITSDIQCKDQNKSTGLPRPTGKGERLLLIGCGGPDGWLYYEVIKRKHR